MRDIIAWWASRWVPFNHLVGLIGLVAWGLVLIAGSAAVRPGVDFEEPIAMIFGPLIYAILANICYLLGPLVNTLDRSGMPSKRLFRAGLFFSLFLAGLPGAWAVAAWVGTLITGHKLD